MMSGSQAPVSNWLHSHSAVAGNPIQIHMGGGVMAQLAARTAEDVWRQLSMQRNNREGHGENP